MGVTGSGLRIRRARPQEAELLTALITRSKAYWGYDAALLDAWRSSLILAPETIARDPVYCAEDVESGIVLGISHFYCLNAEEVYLDHLFVEPESIGRGVGSALWRHVIEQARAAGARAVVFGADPHARLFYERMGAVIADWRESSIVRGWPYPYLRYDLPPAECARVLYSWLSRVFQESCHCNRSAPDEYLRTTGPRESEQVIVCQTPS